MFGFNWKTFAKIGAGVIGIYLCIHYWPGIAAFAGKFLSACAPVFIGLIIAYTVNILMSFYERHYFPRSGKKAVIKSRKPVCMVGAVVTLLGIIALLIGLIAPQLTQCIIMLVEELPAAIMNFLPKLEKIGIVPDDIINMLYSIDWKDKIGDIVKAVTSGIGGVFDVAYSAVTSVFSAVTNFVIGLIFAVYLLADKERLLSQVKRIVNHFIPEKPANKLSYLWTEINDCFHDFIVGQCTEAVILGVLCAIGMLILQIPYAPMIGALMGFTALIPIVGGFIGAGIGAFLILMESPIKALIFVVFVIILQQIEGNLIYPKVVGKSLGLPGIWVLAAVTVGGGVLGIGGLLIGVPLAAAGYRLLQAWLNTPKEDDNADNTDDESDKLII